MADKYDYIAWIDLECAGTDEHTNPILEVGLIVTDKDLNEQVSKAWVIDPEDRFPDWVMAMNEVVRDMHYNNGLLEEVGQYGVSFEEVDGQLAQILDNYTTDGRMPAGGSGVAHFDMRFIRAQLPETTKRLRYWQIDIGAVRRFMRDIVGVEVGKPSEDKPHRALDDIALHVEEARRYREMIREGKLS